jgi:hypothetical protein
MNGDNASREQKAPLVPFRWPSAWTDPSMLRLLAATPINCLLFDSLDRAGNVVAAAKAAGMTSLEWGALGAAPLGEVKWDATLPYVAITGLVWPQIKRSARGGPEVDAGPTGAPWIDSNAWVARLAGARAPHRAIWLGFERPKADASPAQSAYTIAIVDAAAAGARWMITLDDEFQKGLPAGNKSALETWQSIVQALAFFERHPSWAAWERWSSVGVLSSFAGKGEFMGQELLNLAARHNLLYRVLDRAVPASQKFEGLPAVLYLDTEPPDDALQAKLMAFVQPGGLLIVPRALAAAFPGGKSVPCPVSGYELRQMGKGAIAAATEDWEDPYFLAAEVHNLVRRRNDPVTLFNAGSLWEHYSVAHDGRAALLQLVGFTTQPYQAVSLAVAHPRRLAALYTIGAEQPTMLEPKRVEGRLEFHLPAFSYYAALEFRS